MKGRDGKSKIKMRKKSIKASRVAYSFDVVVDNTFFKENSEQLITFKSGSSSVIMLW